MQSTAVKTNPTEVLLPGQPSERLLAALKDFGRDLSDDRIQLALRQTEEARTDFQASAVALGLLLMAKKQAVKHGQWLPWCRAFSEKRSALRISAELSVRTLQDYAFLAQHFLSDIEQQRFAPELKDMAVPSPAIDPEELIALDALPQDRKTAALGAIEAFIAGRSLRAMLAALRRAEAAAEHEEREEAGAKPTTKQHRARLEELKPAYELKGEQLELWREVAHPLTQLDQFLSDEDAIGMTTRTFWKSLETTMEVQLRRVRERLLEAKR